MKKVFALSFFVIFTISATAQDREKEQEYAEMLADFSKTIANKNSKPDDIIIVIKNLGDATFPKRDSTTADKIMDVLSEDARKGVHNTPILEACSKALKKITDEKVVDKLIKVAKEQGRSFYLRYYLIKAFGGRNSEKVTSALKDLLQDKSTQIKIASIKALAETSDTSFKELFLKIIKESDTPYELRYNAIKAFEKNAKDSDLETIIEALLNTTPDEGMVKDALVGILKKISGEDLGSSPKAWDWYAKRKKDSSNVSTGGKGEYVIEQDIPKPPPKFFGIAVSTSRVVFVIDYSGSMTAQCEDVTTSIPSDYVDPMQEDIKRNKISQVMVKKVTTIKDKFDAMVVKNRMDAVKKEFIRLLYSLDENTYFSIVIFSTMPKPIYEELIKATWENKLKAMEFVDEKLEAAGGTNLWGGLETALQFKDAIAKSATKTKSIDKKKDDKPADENAEFEMPKIIYDSKSDPSQNLGGADTVYLMTDGFPSVGRFTGFNNRRNFVAELRRIMETRVLKVHTIAVGNPGNENENDVDTELLKDIAKESNGTYVHVGE